MLLGIFHLQNVTEIGGNYQFFKLETSLFASLAHAVSVGTLIEATGCCLCFRAAPQFARLQQCMVF